MVDSALDIAVEAVRDRASLVRITAQWQDLTRRTLEPDARHDPAMALALLEAAGEGGFPCCLSWARDPERSDLPATLGGVFPFRRGRSSWGFQSWILYAPLVSAEGARRHLAALLDWLKRSGVTVVELRHVPREGALIAALADLLRERDTTVYARDVPAPGDVGGPGLRTLVIGLNTLGEMWVSMLPLLERAKRRLAPASRAVSPAAAA